MTPLKQCFGAVLLLLLAAYPIFSYGPKLGADMQAAGWEPAPELRVITPKCKHWQHMVSTCELNYVDLTDLSRTQPTLDYFIPGSWAGEKSSMLRANGDPGLVTTDIAIRDLKSRRNLMLVWIGLFMALLFGLVKAGLRQLGAVTVFEPQSAAAPTLSQTAAAIPAARMEFGMRRGVQFPTRAG